MFTFPQAFVNVWVVIFVRINLSLNARDIKLPAELHTKEARTFARLISFLF
jgi:hypothetical protein